MPDNKPTKRVLKALVYAVFAPLMLIAGTIWGVKEILQTGETIRITNDRAVAIEDVLITTGKTLIHSGKIEPGATWKSPKLILTEKSLILHLKVDGHYEHVNDDQYLDVKSNHEDNYIFRQDWFEHDAILHKPFESERELRASTRNTTKFLDGRRYYP